MSAQRAFASVGVAMFIAAIVGCGGPRNAQDQTAATTQATARATSSPAATVATPSAMPSNTPIAALPNVFLIVMENTGLNRALS